MTNETPTPARQDDLELVDGQWKPIDLWADVPDNGSLDEHLEVTGWEALHEIGSSDSHLWIRTWHRRSAGQPAEYLLNVNDHVSVAPYILVHTYPELMDLLARWVPAIQVANLVALLDDLGSTVVSDMGTVERVAARVRHGMDATHDCMQAEARDRRRAHAARRAGLNRG